MSTAETKIDSWTRVIVILAIIAVYWVLVRGLLFAYLYDRDMLSWYGDLIDFYNRITKSGFGQGPHPLEEYRQRMDILVIQIAMLMGIVVGIRYMVSTKERRIVLAINVVLIASMLAAMELFLRSDTMQRRTGGLKYVLLDREISKAHIESQNSFGFTDTERTIKRRGNTFRIAVLGDSFVWGDGVEDVADVWSHRLEKTLTKQYGDSVEVLSWGKRGWSTHNQLNFLKNEGVEFEIDYVLIGFVFNDPHVPGRSMPRRSFVWNKLIRKSVPFLYNTITLATDTTNGLLCSLPYFENWGYYGWQRELYSDTNLKSYASVLNELKQHLDAREVEYSWVITSTLHSRGLDDESMRLLALFDSLEIPYIDLRLTVEREFGHLSAAEAREHLWANPADSHPSALLHKLFADETLAHLMAGGLGQEISATLKQEIR